MVDGLMAITLVKDVVVGDAAAACAGDCTFPDGAAMVGESSTDMLVSIGELALATRWEGLEASLGSTNMLGASYAKAIKFSVELTAMKTPELAEWVVVCKLKTDCPTMCPLCTHILVAAVTVVVMVTTLLSAIG